MVRLAIDDTENLRVSDVEFDLPQPSYTIDTLTHLKANYPDHDFSLIMGSDNLASLQKWKNYELLLRDYRFLVYPRRGTELPELASHPSVSITETPIMELSATFIRQAIKDKKSIRFFVPDSVIEFIESKNLYS
jgi:nicotinate-nucleotide adenylyltransferase